MIRGSRFELRQTSRLRKDGVTCLVLDETSFWRIGDLTQLSFLHSYGIGAIRILSPYSRNGGMETCFAESHAAAVKHDVITIEKAIGMIKR